MSRSWPLRGLSRWLVTSGWRSQCAISCAPVNLRYSRGNSWATTIRWCLRSMRPAVCTGKALRGLDAAVRISSGSSNRMPRPFSATRRTSRGKMSSGELGTGSHIRWRRRHKSRNRSVAPVRTRSMDSDITAPSRTNLPQVGSMVQAHPIMWGFDSCLRFRLLGGAPGGQAASRLRIWRCSRRDRPMGETVTYRPPSCRAESDRCAGIRRANGDCSSARDTSWPSGGVPNTLPRYSTELWAANDRGPRWPSGG